ncbi:Sensory transduction histidine kinase (fragment) [uncultured delta proteobacterium]|uniref:histidine kinase n=1 Tax=uncultured delta proteobacterium TaxID=34034 RepID=A0A212JGK4_9DELT
MGVINDILDMSKIEANKFELSFTEFDFEAMLIRVVNVIHFQVEEKKQTLVVAQDKGIPRAIVSDEQRLAQVIANLLANAVKFTPEKGRITLRAGLVHAAEDVCAIRIQVEDAGIGISEEHQRRLFKSFEQADGGIARKFGGTGLGLAISKNIVNLMGGDITVTSEENKGAVFAFTIQVRRGTGKYAPRFNSSVAWEKLRLLAVDTAPETRDFFHAFAEEAGCRCDALPDAEAACAILRDPEYAPDIVFLDGAIGGIGSLELARRIKSASTARSGNIPVVFMATAAEWSLMEHAARSAGADTFISKPLFASLVACRVVERLSPGEAACPPPKDMATADFSGYRILLVEDIEVNREIALSLLGNTGIHIDTAENGREAVEVAERNLDLYDLILMDIHMPEVDGYEATHHIRTLDTPKARRIPIIAMTADVFREDIEKCLAAGMNDHVGKPINIDDVHAKLQRYLPAR